VVRFTKQYNLAHCEGFHVNAPYVAANGMCPMNEESIVVSRKRFSSDLDHLETLYKLSSLLYLLSVLLGDL